MSEGNFIVQAYPNPVKDLLTVAVNGTMGNDATVVLTDALGKRIKQTNLSTPTLTGLAPGLYLLQYTDGTHSQTLKINKQ